ncbi:hypothetical protein GQ43DRAFT_201322 [Delitschia confertaspora ATCC 74209]|uniref:Uncharacterized protein n=1 Tax=Delitschia confertaspora ATCC 74209 TaxID=1513339 RepID=A0A9P4JR22_9PLEO|nr:hypothetical protein GQ43DRAFT_201322 [Delitschia confertaspora ATCC 74209]
MTGGAINALWRANMVYIVGTPSDNCENANNPEAQGYHAKVCLPGEKSAYYVYMLGNHGSPYPQVIPPVGWNHLGELGLGMQNVVASSVAAWRATAFNYANAANHRWNDARNWGSGNTPRDKGASFEGVWTIPVCWDPKGTAVTNMKTDKGRTYPCACGQGPNSEDSGAFAVSLRYEDWQNEKLTLVGGEWNVGILG